jgi:hypothetical protein
MSTKDKDNDKKPGKAIIASSRTDKNVTAVMEYVLDNWRDALKHWRPLINIVGRRMSEGGNAFSVSDREWAALTRYVVAIGREDLLTAADASV